MNPWFMNYGMNVSPVVPLALPSSIVVTGRGNRYDERFQTCRDQGAKVYAYWNPFNIPVGSTDPCDLEQWMGDTADVPRWRYKGGPIRSNWKNTELADITPGSAWRVHYRQISEDIIRRELFDGFYYDTLGARPWAADWENWPQAEQSAWCECAVDLAREHHEMRAKVQADFEIVHNNIWHLPSSHPSAQKAKEGDRYCNGVCLENAPPDKNTGNRSQFHIDYAARSFAGDPYPRRMLIITNNQKLTDQWKADPNVTHLTFVNSQAGQNYMTAVPPVVPYEDERPPPVVTCEEQLAEAQAQVEKLTADNAALVLSNESLTSANAKLQADLDHIHDISGG